MVSKEIFTPFDLGGTPFEATLDPETISTRHIREVSIEVDLGIVQAQNILPNQSSGKLDKACDEDPDQGGRCIVCIERRADAVLLECGHRCAG